MEGSDVNQYIPDGFADEIMEEEREAESNYY
jgi:hypothetical protein